MSEGVAPTSRPSPSGARLSGDDLQHLIAWYWCLKTVIPGSGVESVQVEADAVGNLDDVVVRMRDGSRVYHQVKASVSAKEPANVTWLCAPGKPGTSTKVGRSLLQRLHSAWTDIERPTGGVALITSKPLDPRDCLLAGLDYLNHVGNHLRRAQTEALLEVRAQLAAHLACSVSEVCTFFDALELHLGQTESAWRDKVDDVSLGAGVQAGDVARGAALADVRDWVKQTRDARDGRAVTNVIARLGLQSQVPWAVVVVQALDVDHWNEEAVVVLDWVGKFRGEQPETRRGLIDPSQWNTDLADDLARTRTQLKEQSLSRVLVRGAMRLPGWFAVGATLREVAGFDIAMRYHETVWSTSGESTAAACVKVLNDEPVDGGADIALVVALALDISPDVRDMLPRLPNVGRIITVTVGDGPSRRLFSGAPDTMAAAVAVRDWVRAARFGTTVHLFLAAPAPFAFFLGHLWDRVPPTTLYEDLAPGYEAAFHFKN